MIKLKLAYNQGTILVNPYTISYIADIENTTSITMTNGHSFELQCTMKKLEEILPNEIKCVCRRDTGTIPEEEY